MIVARDPTCAGPCPSTTSPERSKRVVVTNAKTIPVDLVCDFNRFPGFTVGLAYPGPTPAFGIKPPTSVVRNQPRSATHASRSPSRPDHSSLTVGGAPAGWGGDFLSRRERYPNTSRAIDPVQVLHPSPGGIRPLGRAGLRSTAGRPGIPCEVPQHGPTAAGPPDPASEFCQKCGTRTEALSRFCKACGTPFCSSNDGAGRSAPFPGARRRTTLPGPWRSGQTFRYAIPRFASGPL